MVNKKGQSISINVIIVAAIALAVLVVLFAVFTGRIGLFSKGVKQTETTAYECVCTNPTVTPGRICTVQQSGRSSVSADSSKCGGQWTDCAAPLACYSSTA